MTLDVLALVLAAAVAHASWNLFAKPAQGGAGFVWLCAVAGTVLYVPVLVSRSRSIPARWAGRRWR